MIDESLKITARGQKMPLKDVFLFIKMRKKPYGTRARGLLRGTYRGTYSPRKCTIFYGKLRF